MTFHRRHLPHIHLLDHPTFVTIRLHGSLPANRHHTKSLGPHWLTEPTIAALVIEAIHYAVSPLGHFELHAFVVMSNHIHLLLTPRVPLSQCLKSLKSITAKRANEILGRTGQPFWHAESFDRLVRTDAEFHRTVHYIHHNPVRAGLVTAPELYPWSSIALKSI